MWLGSAGKDARSYEDAQVTHRWNAVIYEATVDGALSLRAMLGRLDARHTRSGCSSEEKVLQSPNEKKPVVQTRHKNQKDSTRVAFSILHRYPRAPHPSAR